MPEGTDIKVADYRLVGGVTYDTNTIPLPKEMLVRAGAIFLGEKIEDNSRDKIDSGYTKEYLEGLKMDVLRIIGKKLGVSDNIKSELIDKILEAQ